MGPRLGLIALCLATSLAWPAAVRAADKATCLRAYEVAQQEKEAGKLRAARTKLLVCVEPECPALLRTDCTSWLEEVQRDMPTVVLVARSGTEELSDVRVLVDDELVAQSLTGAALELDPGLHELRLEAAGHEPSTQTVSIRQGEKNRAVVVELTRKGSRTEAKRSPPTASYVLAGVGAVALVSFGYFGLKGLSGRSDLNECKGECAQSDIDAVEADFTRADVSLAVSALAFGGALYFHFAAPREEHPREGRNRGGLALGVAPRSGGFQSSLRLAF